GVTVPPNTSGTFPFSAYFTVPTTSVVDVTDDSGAPPPTKDAASPIPGLTAGSMPGRIASIPIPDAGLGLATRALPNAIAARTYNVYAVIRGGSAPYTCAATGLPGTLTVGPNAVAVPSGPLAGRQACQISGTAPGAGTFADLGAVHLRCHRTPGYAYCRTECRRCAQRTAGRQASLPDFRNCAGCGHFRRGPDGHRQQRPSAGGERRLLL